MFIEVCELMILYAYQLVIIIAMVASDMLRRDIIFYGTRFKDF